MVATARGNKERAVGHGRRTEEKYEVNNNEAGKERSENMHSIGVWW